jgi:hypothetical protein
MDPHLDHQLEFLRALEANHATIAGDVLEIGSHAWAIHGSIPVDGEVIVAEFETSDQALAVLATLSSTPEALRHGDRT